MLNHRQCCHNKRNIYGWNNFQVLYVKKNKTERNGRNGKIVSMRIEDQTRNSLPQSKRKLLSLCKHLERKSPYPAEVLLLPLVVAGLVVSNITVPDVWSTWFIWPEKMKKTNQLARSYELVRYVRKKHENLNYINTER